MSSKLVIHIDDEESFLSISSLILKNIANNIHIISFTSSEEALTYVLKNFSKIDAIISDYYMPFINGIEFLQRIRKDHIDLPFIFLTGMNNLMISSNIEKDYYNCYYIWKNTDLLQTFTEISDILLNDNKNISH